MKAAFEHARKLVHATDLQEAMRIQSEFLRASSPAPANICAISGGVMSAAKDAQGQVLAGRRRATATPNRKATNRLASGASRVIALTVASGHRVARCRNRLAQPIDRGLKPLRYFRDRPRYIGRRIDGAFGHAGLQMVQASRWSLWTLI